MPPAHIAIDGLWNCLRPALSSSTSFNSYRLSNSLRTYIKLGAKPSQCPRQAKKRIFLQTRSFRSIVADYNDDLRPNELRIVDKLYRELSGPTIKADFLRIYKTVGKLVGQYGEAPNARLFLALIIANASSLHGSTTEVKGLLQEMVEYGIELDSAMCHAMLKVLAIHPDYVMRKGVLEEMHSRWFTISREGWHDLIAGLLRDRQIELALDAFDSARKEGVNIQSWLEDTIVYILCDIEEFDEVVAIMRRRVSEGDLTISPTLWFYILDTASRALHHSATLYAWRKRVETYYLNPPSGMCINVLSTAARHGDFRLASDVCRILRNRHETLQLHHYESVLESYTVASDLKTALTIVSVMTSSGVSLSASSLRPVHALLCQTPSLLPSAVPILSRLHEMGRSIPVTVVNVIIEAFVRQGDFDSALETYKTLHLLCPTGPITATFNELFRGCRLAVRKDLAMFLASEMVALKIAPDKLTYDRLILVCLVAGRNGALDAYDDMWQYFKEMRDLKLRPRRATALAMLQAGAEQGDERVWDLAGEKVSSKGLQMAEVETLVRQFWKKGEQLRRSQTDVEAEAEAEAEVDVNKDNEKQPRPGETKAQKISTFD